MNPDELANIFGSRSIVIAEAQFRESEGGGHANSSVCSPNQEFPWQA
jgi:hypothetical protein